MVVVVAISAALVGGCGGEKVTDSTPALDGVQLLGLANGHKLTYMQIDTVTTFYPSYSQTVSQSTRFLNIVGSGSDWVIREIGNPVANLKISPPYVLLNGVWKKTNAGDSLIYYSDPSILMRQDFTSAKTWTGYTPMYPSAEGDTRYPFFNIYFGFSFERRYIGTEQVIVPAGAYTAHRFDVDLFFDGGAQDSLPAATAHEYYSTKLGLVKLNFSGQGLSRSISLIASE